MLMKCRRAAYVDYAYAFFVIWQILADTATKVLQNLKNLISFFANLK